MPEAALFQMEGWAWSEDHHQPHLVSAYFHGNTTSNFVLLSGQSHEHQLDTGIQLGGMLSVGLDVLSF